jgi:hypothetical protein
MRFGSRNQRRESGDEVLGLEQHVSGAVSERALQLKHHQPITIKAQTLLCDGASGPIVYFLGRHTRSNLARSCASQATAQLSENPSRPAVNGLALAPLGCTASNGSCNRIVARPA